MWDVVTKHPLTRSFHSSNLDHHSSLTSSTTAWVNLPASATAGHLPSPPPSATVLPTPSSASVSHLPRHTHTIVIHGHCLLAHQGAQDCHMKSLLNFMRGSRYMTPGRMRQSGLARTLTNQAVQAPLRR